MNIKQNKKLPKKKDTTKIRKGAENDVWVL